MNTGGRAQPANGERRLEELATETVLGMGRFARIHPNGRRYVAVPE